jgi:hypothetical protein
MGYDLYGSVAQRGKFVEYKQLSPYITVAKLSQGFDLLLNDWHLADALNITNFEKV